MKPILKLFTDSVYLTHLSASHTIYLLASVDSVSESILRPGIITTSFSLERVRPNPPIIAEFLELQMQDPDPPIMVLFVDPQIREPCDVIIEPRKVLQTQEVVDPATNPFDELIISLSNELIIPLFELENTKLQTPPIIEEFDDVPIP